MRNSFYTLLSIILLLLSCGEEKTNTIKVSKTNITESVYSSVTIQPDSLYEVYSSVMGILESIYVEEGDTIKKATPLFQIINNNPKLNTENAKLSMNIAEEKFSGENPILKDLANEIELAKLKYQNDSINFIRQEKLFKQNIGSKLEFENKKLAYKSSKHNLNILINKYNRTKKELRQQLELATNNYKASLISTKDFTIQSKIDGRIYSINKNPGEIINTQQPLATIGSKSCFIAELLIDEVDITKVEVGQQVAITLDAYGDNVFESTIQKIYPKKNERSQTFKIEATFNENPEKLYPGLSGEANIIVNTKKEVIVIPKEYIIEGNKVKTEEGIIEIVTGLESLDKIEVVAGIDENTIIYQPSE